MRKIATLEKRGGLLNTSLSEQVVRNLLHDLAHLFHLSTREHGGRGVSRPPPGLALDLGENCVQVLVAQVEDGLVDEVVKVLDEHLLYRVEVYDQDAFAEEAVETNQLLVSVPETTKRGLVHKCLANIGIVQ